MDPSDIDNYMDLLTPPDAIDMSLWGETGTGLPEFSDFIATEDLTAGALNAEGHHAAHEKSSSKRAEPSSAARRTEPSKRRKRAVAHPCENCGANFSTPSNLKLHFDKVHVPPLIASCIHCTASFSTPRQLRRHVKGMHPAQHDPLNCGNCGARFGRSDHCNKHVRAFHVPSPAAACTLCPGTFAKTSQLVLHLRSVHEQEASSTHVRCFQCGLVCGQDKIDGHIWENHTGDLKAQCLDCGAKFRSAEQLGMHLKNIHKQ